VVSRVTAIREFLKNRDEREIVNSTPANEPRCGGASSYTPTAQ
jgi:hypothetical protein